MAEMRAAPGSWRALGREMLSILLGMALFLQLMGRVEMPRLAAGFDPATALCSLHPPEPPGEPDKAPKGRHDLCCLVGCSLHAKPWAGLSPAGPALPLPGLRILAAVPPAPDAAPAPAPHAPHGARDPPFPA